MTNYETLFIINPNIAQEDISLVIDRVKNVIETGGTVTEIAEWGKKRLAYEIQKLREGYYVLIKFQAQAKTLDELNHVYRITENILRGIIVKQELSLIGETC